MKKTISDIFDEAKANEIENLVNQNDATNVSDDIVCSVKKKVYAKTGIANMKKKKSVVFGWKSYVAAAAALCVIVNAIIIAPILKKMYSDTLNPDTIISPDNTTAPPETLAATSEFKSFDEFERYERNATSNGGSYYYVPASLSSDYELLRITKRDKAYVMIEYSVFSRNLSAENLDDYAVERLSTLICRYSLHADARTVLQQNFIANGYEMIEFEGKTYYRWDEYTENDPKKQIIGYEIAFLVDDGLVFMHLPAIDTFENMMRYANVVKVNID